MDLKYFPGEDRSKLRLSIRIDNSNLRATRAWPRLSSRALARMLGMNHEEMLQVIERNREELEQHGVLIETPEEEEGDDA